MEPSIHPTIQPSIHPTIHPSLKPAVKCGSGNKEGTGTWLRTSALRSSSADPSVDRLREERAEWIIRTWSPFRCLVCFFAQLPHHLQQRGGGQNIQLLFFPQISIWEKERQALSKVLLKKTTGYPGERRCFPQCTKRLAPIHSPRFPFLLFLIFSPSLFTFFRRKSESWHCPKTSF